MSNNTKMNKIEIQLAAREDFERHSDIDWIKKKYQGMISNDGYRLSSVIVNKHTGKLAFCFRPYDGSEMIQSRPLKMSNRDSAEIKDSVSLDNLYDNYKDFTMKIIGSLSEDQIREVRQILMDELKCRRDN